MINNDKFLQVIRESFATYLVKGTSRSSDKLNPLHGLIAKDLKELLGNEFRIQSKGYANGKEGSIDGRYYKKNVDITVSKSGITVAGYAVKFIMRNYSQNSNNYFENMLGETANIRSTSIPYFQIFIMFEKVPYYEDGEILKKYDIFSAHNLQKYIVLSKDDASEFYHTPDKALIVLIKLKDQPSNIVFNNANEYNQYYLSKIDEEDLLSYSSQTYDPFGENVILNDYENFLIRTYHIILGKMK